MADAASIQWVRTRTSDQSSLVKEPFRGDGVTTRFSLKNQNIATSPALIVTDDGVVVAAGYTVDVANGAVTFSVAPTINHEIVFEYHWTVFTDTEVGYFLDDSNGDVAQASAKLLLAWAASAAKLAKRQTLLGGTGRETLDTSVASKELRETAKSIIDLEATMSANTPSEDLTEPVWTEAGYEEGFSQHVIREG